jgi:hypothetical protein
MGRLLLAGAVLVALAIGFYVWSDDDDSGRAATTPGAVADQRAAEIPSTDTATHTTTTNPRRVVPPARGRPLPAAPGAAEPSSRGNFAPTPASGGSTGGSVAPQEKEREIVDELMQDIRDADVFWDKGDYEAAVEAGKALLEKYPGNLDAYKITVLSLCAMGEPDEARRYIDEVPESTDRKYLVRHCAKLGLDLKKP